MRRRRMPRLRPDVHYHQGRPAPELRRRTPPSQQAQQRPLQRRARCTPTTTIGLWLEPPRGCEVLCVHETESNRCRRPTERERAIETGNLVAAQRVPALLPELPRG